MTDDARPDLTSDVPTGAVRLADVLRTAAAEGFSVEFDVADDGDHDRLLCPHCSQTSPAVSFLRAWSHRLEGVSDPADMLHVSALTCPVCGADGVFVTPYGQSASDRQATVLRELPGPERVTPLSPE
jgi:hypothetical protein